jgi:hypothetical protein
MGSEALREETAVTLSMTCLDNRALRLYGHTEEMEEDRRRRKREEERRNA